MRSRGLHRIYLYHWLQIVSCLVICCSETAAQNREVRTHTVDINIFNRYDDHLIDSTYMGNREMFQLLDSLMCDTTILNHTGRIDVHSSSSIEGSVAYNRALSSRRMQTIEATFRSRYNHIAADMWHFSCNPENWIHLRSAVVADTLLPHRKEVLAIIEREELHPDKREELLKTVEQGVPWSYIHQHILPASRGSVSMLFVPQEIIYSSTMAVPVQGIEQIAVPLTPRPTLALPTLQATYSRPILSIRSNLLLDITSTLNIGVEIPLAPHWSVAASYTHPWWSSWNSQLTWQLHSLYFDLRYWWGSRERYNDLTGWSVGAYAGSGCYDLQPFMERGVQGEYSDYGLTLSYAHYLGQSRHWLMEYNLGLGYLTTHYRHYYTAANTEEYGNIKVHNYPWSEETLRAPLPTRLGVTLCYLIRIGGVKRGGER